MLRYDIKDLTNSAIPLLPQDAQDSELCIGRRSICGACHIQRQVCPNRIQNVKDDWRKVILFFLAQLRLFERLLDG